MMVKGDDKFVTPLTTEHHAFHFLRFISLVPIISMRRIQKYRRDKMCTNRNVSGAMQRGIKRARCFRWF